MGSPQTVRCNGRGRAAACAPRKGAFSVSEDGFLKPRHTWHGIYRVILFARRHWIFIAATIAATAASAGSEAIYIYFARPLVNAFTAYSKGIPIENVTEEQLMFIGKLALAVGPLVALLTLGQHFLQGQTVARLTVSLRNTICRALLPQSLSFFENRRSGDLMSRITNDVNRTKTSFMLIFGDIPQNVFHAVGGFALAAYADWRVLILSSVVFPAVVVPVSYLARRIRRYGRQGLMKLADLTDLMAQMFSGIRVIKAFRMEDAESEEFERANRRYFRKLTKTILMRSLSAGTIELVVRCSIGVSALVGVWLLVNGHLDIELGALVVCIGGLYFAFQGVRKLVKNYNQLQEIIPAADRIFELVEHPPEMLDGPDAVALPRIERGIVFRDVSFGYGDELVLRDVSFEVKRGQRVAVVGRSGAGKSTLIALLCRFYDVTEGAVEIDGIDVRLIKHESLLDQIAIVTQQTFLFNRSIADNIRYGRRDATQKEIETAAKSANIHDFIVTLPDGYNSLCGEFGAKVSGGQRQRIAIARALLKNADMLILDEAMVGLDKESEKAVGEAMERLMQGRTVFTISHDLPTIQNADLILVLESGRLVGQGRHTELLGACEEYRAQYALQFASLPSPALGARA